MKRVKNATVLVGCCFLRNNYTIGIMIIILIVVVYLISDSRGPRKITLQKDVVFGLNCLRACDLIVQQYDSNGNLWAIRGMNIYCLKKGDKEFMRIAHVPTGLNLYWLRNFTLVRRLTLRPECIEMIPTKDGTICALSAGRIWYRSKNDKKFHETLKLSHYGFGDQGIRNNGIIHVNDSMIFFGEYFKNPYKTFVKIYESLNNGRTWNVAHEFQPGQIRHVHALQKDPYTGKQWVCTGDLDKEAMVAWSSDDYKTIQPIGHGSQIWRVTQLVFTEDAVYWGADSRDEDLSGIYRWQKDNEELQKLRKADGAIMFATRLAQGTIVMSTDRENMALENDTRTRIYIITQDQKITQVDCGTWKHNKPGFRFKFAILRFQRDQGGPSLVISCLNQKELPDGELIIIPEEVLLAAAR